MHKSNLPNRPLVNFAAERGYNTAKKLVETIRDNSHLQNTHANENDIEFINNVGL